MINLPYNVPLVAQIMPTQSIPVQTSQNNLQPFHQPQTITQQMQTNPVAFPGNPQDSCKPYFQFYQSDATFANQQYIPNPSPPRNPYNLIPQTQTIPNPPVAQTQASCGQLPPSVVEQIRSAVSSTAPIFILPGGCHQSASHQQQPPPVYPSNQGGVSPPTGPWTGFNYPPSIYCPPSFVPYPIPLPLYEPFTGQTRAKEKSQTCGCPRTCRHESEDIRNNDLINSFWNPRDSQEHRCTLTVDDTVCSKRNCPAAISLQALASQFLSLPGIVSCAATRLILRKVLGSNVTDTMDETMEKAQRAIGMLGKDQLLAESRIAQQVNALINLHATTNVPARIVPLLMLVQAKVNILKAQVENLVNKKVMECQGYGFEVETSGPIDPAVFASKSNAELRQLLAALRQKECDERMNANFAPYHSQRVIAESRLRNVQAKIRQVEAEFDNRRQVTVPEPTLTSQIIRQFSESRCIFGYAPSKLFEPCPDSPDPFSPTVRNPRRLYIKPHQPEPPSTSASGTSSTSKDTGTGEGNARCDTKDQSVGRRCSRDSCICGESSSEDSLDEDKKKLRAVIDRNGNARIIGRITVVEAQLQTEDDVDRSNRGCQAPCEVPRSMGENGNKEIKETGDEEMQSESELAEAEGTKVGERNDKGEQVVSQTPEDSSESKVTEANSTKEEQSDTAKEEQTARDSMIETEEATKNQEKKVCANVRVIEAINVKKFDKMQERSDHSKLGDETKPGSGNEENVQIVAMMTNIEYDRSAGDFGRYTMTHKRTEKEFQFDNPENAKNETDLPAEKIGSTKACDTNDQKFLESLGSHDQKVTGEFKHFPPLKRTKSHARTARISQFVPHQVHLDSSKIDHDGSTSGHREASSRNSVVSAIRSMIRYRFDCVGSLVDNVPNLQTIFSNLYSNKLWSALGTVPLRQDNMEPNKTAISRKDDWILLPTDIDREPETQTRQCYLPVASKPYRVRKIKHTIIRNRGNKSYVLIGGSTSGQLEELSGIRLLKPSGFRRSFVIRSRLKDQNSKQLHPPPAIMRRLKTNKMSASPKLKQSERRLKPSEKFCSLSNDLTNSTSSLGKQENYTKVSPPVNADGVSGDRSAAEIEKITNICDYSAEQEQLGV
ncbi:uncharacterized protein LOC143213097 [Lasioglossum baleicum]|uniref:uncharacterized protein LOC143213097 n=1 Tax=Lasioglossum baleicum TaxID=434251 RepID=UPI003FCD8851